MPETKDEAIPLASTMTMGLVHPDNALRMIFGIAQQIGNVFSAPVEMFLRPNFGSQYLHPITVILSWILLQIFVVISFLAHMSANALHKPLHGWLGMGLLLTAFDLGFIYHLIRVRRLMLDMSKEEDSETEGPALLFMSKFPGGQGWARVRVFY